MGLFEASRLWQRIWHQIKLPKTYPSQAVSGHVIQICCQQRWQALIKMLFNMFLLKRFVAFIFKHLVSRFHWHILAMCNDFVLVIDKLASTNVDSKTSRGPPCPSSVSWPHAGPKARLWARKNFFCFGYMFIHSLLPSWKHWASSFARGGCCQITAITSIRQPLLQVQFLTGVILDLWCRNSLYRAFNGNQNWAFNESKLNIQW